MAYMSTRGVSAYDQTAPPWSWMFYPPPYDFENPDPTTPPPTFIAPASEMGLGPVEALNRGAVMKSAGMSGCGCGGACGGCGGGHAHGMGLFDTGLDISGWGWPEWGIVAIGAYAVYSVLFTTKSGISAARSSSRSRRRRKLKQQLQAI